MADTSEKQATCPLCGYTDTALDTEALQTAMQEHMRMSHNQVLGATPANTGLKETGAQDDLISRAMPAPGVNTQTSPSLNAGNSREL